MKFQTDSNLDKIENLLKGKKYPEALKKLNSIDTASMSDEALAYYHLLLCEIKLNMGHYEIEKELNIAVAYYRNSSDNKRYAKAKYLQGWLMSLRGNFLSAKELLLESYLNYKRYNEFGWMARVLNRLALVQFQTGSIDDAVSNLVKCIDIYIQLKNIETATTIRRNLASVYFMSGALRNSISTYKELESKSKSHNDVAQYQYYLTYSMATALQGNIKAALSLIAKTTRHPDDYKREKAQYYEYLGWIYNLDEQYQKAAETLKTGVELSLKIAPESALISQSKRLLADAYFGLGKFDLAEKTVGEALIVAEKINERVEIAACYRVFARVEHQRGDKEKALELYKKAMEIFAVIQSRYELAVTRYLAAESDCYDNGERDAMLYLARAYFESEDVHKYVEKIDKVLASRPKIKINRNPNYNDCPVFIATDPKMEKVVDMAEHIARSDMTVLLTGPTGSGKDQLAKFIHYCSGRKGRFVTVNSAAIPDSMIESELFGFRKGAFTGAERDNQGLMTEADGGTFYLNEIADATPEFQAKLLEVIENKTIRPLGGGIRRKIDIRIIAATNHDLEARMREGKFRPDLFHRLNVIPIELPGLCDRLADIPALARHFLSGRLTIAKRGEQRNKFDELCHILANRVWDGNIRELKGYIDRLYLLADGDIGRMSEMARNGHPTEREMLLKTLQETNWNRLKAARILGVSEGTIRNHIKKFDLEEHLDS
ncbi:MAG: sigma 54-interacting transcriptional regulator [Deltaproteobacteria bacterium]|nr:sigma 54-interacting transcriptional regulator [Deltaproteobacteria bacterium]